MPITLSLVHRRGRALDRRSASRWACAAAARQGTAVDPLMVLLGIVGVSIPVYWLGEVVNLLTQSRLHDSVFSWVPPLGYVAADRRTRGSGRCTCCSRGSRSPSLYAGIYARILRSEMVVALNEDYVRTARAKGVSERRILLKHALRCSLIPIVSLFGLDFGALVGGAALLTEVVFGLPGVGKLTYDALQNVDLPVIMGCVLYAAFFVVLANALVDLAYAGLDPRVRRA